MLFSTNLFVFTFFSCVLIGYFFISLLLQKVQGSTKVRNIFLLIASLFFYYWGSGKLILLLFLLTAINYISAYCIAEIFSKDTWKKAAIILCILSNIVLLVYFKYMNFFYDIISGLAAKQGMALPSLAKITLPIGISFYAFQALSYSIDVYRKRVPLQKNILKLLLYISFFPQLIAGPIVRYETVYQEIEDRHSRLKDVYDGFMRFSQGLAKKVIIADTFGAVTASILALNLTELDAVVAWIGAILYTLQIYFDFSGYSDMAIGMARIFGFHFNENFILPYTSENITEFWRRWHVSLSTWFRDYLYIPLGGNRKGNARTYLNLFVVFVLCGLWHGANFTFIVWGLYHGLLLVIERVAKHKYQFQMKGILGRVVSFLLALIGWVFFMSKDLSYAFEYLKRMFLLSYESSFVYFTPAYYIQANIAFILIIALTLACLRLEKIREWFENSYLKGVVCVFLFGLSMIFMSKASFTPFIYFQF